jgi:endonuclease I
VKTTVSYDGAWEAFAAVDKFLPGYPCSSDLDMIPDIYSDYCWKTEKVVPGGECGNYKREGDCFNREHSWPKSWFGGFDAGDGAQSDLFELYPSDGYVNGLRGNLPLGYVNPNTITYQSTNGSRIGTCASDPSIGKCFEVSDDLKGDLARTYFYLSTAYYLEWSCCDEPGVDLWNIKPWMESDMRAWHAADPVNDQERARNDEIYTNWQHNRNPYIDHPEWVDQISDF